MRLAVGLMVCVVAAGCGRFDFGDRADAETSARPPVDHDEDEDGIPDVSDPCPHLAGDATDTDGDGVGDACDPHPNTGGDHIRVFGTLTPGDDPFLPDNDFAQEADSLRAARRASVLYINGAITSARIELGFDIHGLVGSGQHQISSGVGVPGIPSYFVELNENGGSRDLAVDSYDETTGTFVAIASMTTNGMHPGRGFIQYDTTAGPSPRYATTGGWIGELYAADGATPMYTGGPGVEFTFNGLDIAVRYVIIIETP